MLPCRQVSEEYRFRKGSAVNRVMPRLFLFCTILLLWPLLSQNTVWAACTDTEESLRTYITSAKSPLDPIEGIWSLTYTRTIYDSSGKQVSRKVHQDLFRVGIKRAGALFDGCILTASDAKLVGRGIGQFQPTSTPGAYLFKLAFLPTGASAKAVAGITSKRLLSFVIAVPKEQVKHEMGDKYDNNQITTSYQLLRLFPLSKGGAAGVLSGSGFAIAENGMIVTNSHVVNGATRIRVKGVEGNFSRTYSARIVAEDARNDLALLRIDDPGFSKFSPIPFGVRPQIAQIGENVFVLGYPLRASMGDDIKLTNGIISATSGVRGNLTMYQISAPIQRGNSGGPLFDAQGNLIGIIRSKHSEAENASYAIKATHLVNLIETLKDRFPLPEQNAVAGKPLPEQVAALRQFVFIIEAFR